MDVAVLTRIEPPDWFSHWKGLEDQRCYRLNRAGGRSAWHEWMRAPLRKWLGLAVEVSVVPPGCPHDACELVGESHGSLVVAASLLNIECPEAQPIERFASPLGGSRGDEDCPRAVDEQGPQVRIALLADAPETSSFTGGVLARCKANPAGEVPRRGEALDVHHRST